MGSLVVNGAATALAAVVLMWELLRPYTGIWHLRWVVFFAGMLVLFGVLVVRDLVVDHLRRRRSRGHGRRRAG